MQPMFNSCMVGSMYLQVTTSMVFDLPPMSRILVKGAPMHAAADAGPFRRLCDVHLNCAGGGGEAPMALHRCLSNPLGDGPCSPRVRCLIGCDGLEGCILGRSIIDSVAITGASSGKRLKEAR
jgi:hypothetical protein